MIEQHHVVLDHAKPFRFRIASGTRRIFLALQVLSLRSVGSAALESAFFIVPEGKTCTLQFEALKSYSVWGFYTVLVVLILLARWIVLP